MLNLLARGNGYIHNSHHTLQTVWANNILSVLNTVSKMAKKKK